MNIGIIDADLMGRKKHRFPNLASMKISNYNKSIGNNVKLITSYDDDMAAYDDIYLSKVFTDTVVPDNILKLDNIHLGGTGFYFDKAPNLLSNPLLLSLFSLSPFIPTLSILIAMLIIFFIISLLV